MKIRSLLPLVLLLSASVAHAQVPLGTAEAFGVLGASTVTNTGPTVITGSVGVSPGSAITGFPPGVATAALHTADAVALQAQNDATLAYNFLAAQTCGTPLTGDLGGRTLTPGVYCFAAAAQLTGTVTLDGLGNPASTFIIQVGSALTTASASNVVLINGAQACNVWWQMGSSATLGTATAFSGTLVALASDTLTTGATLVGRALARTGAVTLDTNTVTIPTCAPVVVPPGPNGAGGTAQGIPTLNEWGMLILAVLMALVAAGFMRRKARP